MVRGDRLDGLGDGGFRIFDILRFIQDAVLEVLVLIQHDISLESVVRSNAHVVIHILFELSLAGSKRAAQDQCSQGRRKSPELLLPVVDKGSGAHDQGRPRTSEFFVGVDHADHLQCFAKAHFVREDPSEAGCLEGPEPLEAVSLVGTQSVF